MNEENQSMGGQVGFQSQSTPPTQDFRSKLQELNLFKQETNLRKAKQVEDQTFDNAKNLHMASLNTTDPKLKQTYDLTGQMEAAAGILKQKVKSDWGDWDTWTTPQVINTYYSLFPDEYQSFTEQVHSQNDPEAWGVQMGYLPDLTGYENEEERNFWGGLADWGGDVLSSFGFWVEKWGFGIQNIVNRATNLVEPEDSPFRKASARENYAEMNYGKSYYALSDEEKAEADAAVATEEWKEMYKPTPQRATLAWVEGGVDMAYTAAAPLMKLLISAGSNTPVTREALGLVGKLFQIWGRVINYLPPLAQFRNSLQTEEEKQEMDWLIGMLVSIKWGKIKNDVKSGKYTNPNGWGGNWGGIWKGWKLNNINWKQLVLDEINPAETLRWVKENLGDNMLKRNPEKLTQNAEEVAWEIWQWTIKDRPRVQQGLSEADLDWVKTYWELGERLKTAEKNIVDEKKQLLSRNTNKYGENDLSLTKEVETVDWVKQVTTDPFLDAIDALTRKAQEAWDKAAEARYNAYSKKIKEWEVSQPELSEIQAEFNKEFSSKAYDKNDNLKNTISADASDNLRVWMNEVMEWLADKSWDMELSSQSLKDVNNRYSNTARTLELVNQLSEKVNAAKQKLAKRNLLQKAMWVVWDILDVTWVKALVKKMIGKWAEGESTMSPLDLEKKLESNLKKIERLNEKLDSNAPDAEVLSFDDGARVWLTSVNGYEPVKSDALFKKWLAREKKGNQTKANEYYNKSLEAWEQVLRDEFGENITLDKWIGRYGWENEPTHVMNIPKYSPDMLPKIADIANNVFKQKSVFVARRYKGGNVKLGVVDRAKGTSNEMGIRINLKKSIEKMSDLDSIMEEIWQYGGTLSNWGKTIEIFNLSQFNPDRSAWLIDTLWKIGKSETLKKFWIENADHGYYEIQHIWLEWEWLWNYNSVK